MIVGEKISPEPTHTLTHTHTHGSKPHLVTHTADPKHEPIKNKKTNIKRGLKRPYFSLKSQT